MKNSKNNQNESMLFGNLQAIQFSAESEGLEPRKSSKEGKAKFIKGAKVLKSNGLPIKLDDDSSFGGEEIGDTPEERKKDLFAIRDFAERLSSIYSSISAAEKGGELQDTDLDSKLGQLAETYAAAMMDFERKVANSKSLIFSDRMKRDAEENLTRIEVMLGKGEAGSRVRALRSMFIPTINFMSGRKFPDIKAVSIESADDLLELIAKFGYLQYIPSVSEGAHVSLKRPQDRRGVCDVNATFDLHLLYVSDHLRDHLKALGVSDEIIALLGNYTIPVGDAGDDTDDFSADLFVDAGDTALEKDSVRRWSGPRYCAEIEEDLLRVVKEFRVKAKAIISGSMEDAVDGAALFSPDIAVKYWIQHTLNAVFKVMVEDGCGIMDRARSSNLLSFQAGTGSKFVDVAMEFYNTNTNFLARPIDDVEDYLKSGAFYYNPIVYKFMKESWAPVIKEFSYKAEKYCGDTKMPDEKYRVTLIPKLYLPVNPYDSQALWYEKNINEPFGSHEESDRSVMFTNVVLPYSYLDTRNKMDFNDITLYFDNMFSRAMAICCRNSRFNYHSNHSVKNSGTDSSVGADKGAWVIEEDKAALGVREQSMFRPELYSSCHDREARLGLQYGDSYPVIHQITCGWVAKGKVHNELIKGHQMLMAQYHTNPLSVRMMAIAQWFKDTPSFITWASEMNNRFQRFVDGVMDGKCPLSYIKSKTFIPAQTFNKGAAFKDLSIKDAFRMSFITDTAALGDDKPMYIIDNTKVGVPSTLFGTTGDSSTAAADRKVLVLSTKVDARGSLDSSDVKKEFVNYEGGIDIFHGCEPCVSSYGSGELAGYSALNGKEIAELVASDEFYVYSNKHRLGLGGILTHAPKYYSNKGQISFNRRKSCSAFTKLVCAGSYQTYRGSEPTRDSRAPAADTWMPTSEEVCRWGSAIKTWNAANPDMVIYAANNGPFDLAVDFVFHGFTYVGGADNAYVDSIKYSCGVYAVIGTHPSGGTDVTSRDCVILDPVENDVVAIAHVFGPSRYADEDATRFMMNILGQKVIDTVSPATRLYNRGGECGLCVNMSASMAHVDIRRLSYKSHLKDIHDSDVVSW